VHALAVNQAWAGHPGTVFQQSDHSIALRATCEYNTTCDNHGKGATPRVTVPSWQAWYKPLPGHGAAIFVANHDTSPASVMIDFADVPGLSSATSYKITDVWKQEPLAGEHSRFSEAALAPRDSTFITVVPARNGPDTL